MFHLAIFIGLLSFTFGLAAFLAAWYFYILYRVQIIKSFFQLQLLIEICVLTNMFYEYIVTNLNSSRILLTLWHSLNFIWAPFFFYYSIKYILHIAHLTVRPGVKWLVKGYSLLIGLSGLFIILFRNSPEDIYKNLEMGTYLIVLPSCVLTGLISFIVMAFRYKNIQNKIIRSIMRINMILNAALIPVLFFLYFSNPMGRNLNYKNLKTFIDIFFLLWNIQGIILFIFYSRKNEVISARNSNKKIVQLFQNAGEVFSDSLNKYEFSGPGQDNEEEELKEIENRMAEEKLFLDSELTLISLAEIVSIPRNRLSFLINQYRGQNFCDFVNRYRIQEAKKLLKLKKEGMNILQIAFDSGFNSKGAFYQSFKKSTGMSPTEYQTSKSKKAML